MPDLLRHADKPAISVPPETTVHGAVQTMVQKRVGAVVVLDEGRAAGMFSERDVMAKVVLNGLDPTKTPVSAVMTSPVHTISAETDEATALTLMVEKHIRHLPVVDGQGNVQGMLSIRHLMQDRIDELKDEVNALEAYMSYDGAVG